MGRTFIGCHRLGASRGAFLSTCYSSLRVRTPPPNAQSCESAVAVAAAAAAVAACALLNWRSLQILSIKANVPRILAEDLGDERQMRRQFPLQVAGARCRDNCGDFRG